MINRHIVALVAAAGAGVALALGVGLVVGAPDTAIPWSVFGSGGSTTSSSASYNLGSTAGQSAIGPTNSGITGKQLGAGFWYGVCAVGSLVDNDCDATADATETACGSNPGNPASIPERLDGAFAGVSDDGDGPVDEALPGGSETLDCDGDGWPGNQENLIYGDAPSTVRDQDPCGNNGWPSELAGNNNTLNIADINSFLSPVRSVINPPVDAHSTFNRFSHPLDDWGAGGPGGGNPPDGTIDQEMARWNLQTPPHLAGTLINIGDLNGLITGAAGSPARPRMFGEQYAFYTNGGNCPWPP